MTSQLDQAQEFEERDRQTALARVHKRLSVVHSDWLICVDCGEDIPKARREAVPGTKFCIECANFRERKHG